MTGRVQQGHFDRIAQTKHSLFGKDGDAARAFNGVGIQKGVFVVNATQLAHRAGFIQDCFR